MAPVVVEPLSMIQKGSFATKCSRYRIKNMSEPDRRIQDPTGPGSWIQDRSYRSVSHRQKVTAEYW
jgi:hypothetical protein